MKNILKFLILFLVIFLLVNSVSATILTSSANPQKIFKCGNSVISATFNDAAVTSVTVFLNSTAPVQPMIPGSGRISPESESTFAIMVFNGTYWNANFGNNASLLRGERTVIYKVTAGVVNTYISSTKVEVYSDVMSPCTGVISNYTQTQSGLGNYTSKLFSTNINLIDWALFPWIQVWGFMFFVIILLTISIVVYFKTGTISMPLVLGILGLFSIANFGYIPAEYRIYVIMLIGLLIGILLRRIFVQSR